MLWTSVQPLQVTDLLKGASLASFTLTLSQLLCDQLYEQVREASVCLRWAYKGTVFPLWVVTCLAFILHVQLWSFPCCSAVCVFVSYLLPRVWLFAVRLLETLLQVQSVSSQRHIYTQPHFIFKSSLLCSITRHTSVFLSLSSAFSAQRTANVSSAQRVLFELYPHCVGGLLQDGFGSTPARADFLSDLMECVFCSPNEGTGGMCVVPAFLASKAFDQMQDLNLF